MSQSPPLPSRTPENSKMDSPSAPSGEQFGVASPERRKWLGLSVAACGAALLLASKPVQASSGGDLAALTFLEDLELMQTDFFTRVSSSTAYDGMEQRERDVFNLIASQDREHAAWFRQARSRYGISPAPGSTSALAPRRFSFPATAFVSRTTLFPLAVSIKDTAVAAYHGVVGNTRDGDLIEALAALAGIEGRHSSAIREIYGINSLETAFEPALSKNEVARRLAPYGFNGGAN